jgi:hypothetical protein
MSSERDAPRRKDLLRHEVDAEKTWKVVHSFC